MADETENTEEPQTPDEQAPEQDAPAAEAPAEETPAQEAPAPDPEPAAEAPADEAEAAAEAPAPEGGEQAPADDRPAHRIRKSLRRAERGPRRPRTPEERAELRKGKAAARSRYRKNRRERDKAKRKESPAQVTAPVERTPGNLKVRLGTVVSDKADKTITVRIDTARRHRRYEKIVRSSSTLHAHDETNDAHVGDTVRVQESRPMSRSKRWTLIEVVERAK